MRTIVSAAQASQRDLVLMSLIVRPGPKPPKAQLVRRDGWGR
jgi:hypothetical protein